MGIIKLTLVVIFAFIISGCRAQDTNFHIQFPENWIEFQRSDVLNSVKYKYEIPDSLKAKILKNQKSVQIYGYAAPAKAEMKYRPNIQVLLLKKPTTNNKDFKRAIESSMQSFKTVFSNLQIIDSFTTKTIDNKNAIYGKISGLMNTKSGEKVQVTTRIYAIPVGKYFYQLTFNDTNDYNFESVFNEVISTIKLN